MLIYLPTCRREKDKRNRALPQSKTNFLLEISLISVITTTTPTTACKSKNAPCKATDTCCDNGRCQVNGADVTGTTEGTCRVA